MKNTDNNDINLHTICGSVLPRDFYLAQTLDVAKSLLGCILAVAEDAQVLKSALAEDGRICLGGGGFKAGRIVETEAYLGFSDSAAHSYNKKPGGRSNAMFGECGHAYVYLIYGMYHCFNTVTQPRGVPEGVLIRALEPLAGEHFKSYSGPGKLCRQMGISRSDYATDLTGSGRIAIVKPDDFSAPKIGVSHRIGVENSGEGAVLPYRFFDSGSKSVSRMRKGQSQE